MNIIHAKYPVAGYDPHFSSILFLFWYLSSGSVLRAEELDERNSLIFKKYQLSFHDNNKNHKLMYLV